MKIYLKIKPNQRVDKVELAGEEWIIRLAAPAVDGKANEHLLSFLSEVLSVAKSRIRLVKGSTSRVKCLEIEGEAEILLQRLHAAVKP
jgi:uncharacterized protein (TIGR00251 family)